MIGSPPSRPPSAHGVVLAVALALAIGAPPLPARAGPASTSPDPHRLPTHWIAHRVGAPVESFNLVVGHSHHVIEASTDRAEANHLITVDEGALRTYEATRAELRKIARSKHYRHYGGLGEPPEPLCRVLPQQAVDTDGEDSLLNDYQPKTTVSCTLKDGSILYVTSWDP